MPVCCCHRLMKSMPKFRASKIHIYTNIYVFYKYPISIPLLFLDSVCARVCARMSSRSGTIRTQQSRLNVPYGLPGQCALWSAWSMCPMVLCSRSPDRPAPGPCALRLPAAAPVAPIRNWGPFRTRRSTPTLSSPAAPTCPEAPDPSPPRPEE